MTTDEIFQWAKDNSLSQTDIYRQAKGLYDAGFITKEDLPLISEQLGIPKEEPHPITEWLKK